MSSFEIPRANTSLSALAFLEKIASGDKPLFLLGRNIYSEKIINNYKVSGIIDDSYTDSSWNGVPVSKLVDTPHSSLVLVCAGGRTLTALERVRSMGFESLDYFSFYKAANNSLLQDVVFNENFSSEFEANKEEYAIIYDLLEDEESKNIFRKLVSFRLNYDINELQGFTTRLEEQYFEDFLELNYSGEVFADVGCFDGFTTLEFIKRCPGYQKVFAFEPEPKNFEVCRKNFANVGNVELLPFGLGSKKETLKFSADGSASTISSAGHLEINVQKLDELPGAKDISFLKMDIEGGESSAVEGAASIISKYHPKIAISVYHKPGDFWRIPKQILSYHRNYKIFMRHYTETIYETVMFFIPR